MNEPLSVPAPEDARQLVDRRKLGRRVFRLACDLAARAKIHVARHARGGVEPRRLSCVAGDRVSKTAQPSPHVGFPGFKAYRCTIEARYATSKKAAPFGAALASVNIPQRA